MKGETAGREDFLEKLYIYKSNSFNYNNLIDLTYIFH